MVSRLKAVAVATIVVGAALAPLFGDPRATAVTHPIWARMLLRALAMEETVRASTLASQVFAALSWRDSLTFPADHYVRGDGVRVRERDGLREVVTGEATGEVVYPLAVVGGGDYHVRVRLAGAPGRPATAEIVPAGASAALKTFTFVPAAQAQWVRGGRTHLDPGAYTATVLLPRGSSLEYVEIAPPCLNAIEPAGGWKPTAPTTVEDVAVTAVKAMDLESELPPADTPLERTGGDFQLDEPEAGTPTDHGFDRFTLKAGQAGLGAVLSVELAEAGLYTLSAFVGTGAAQRWLADGCRKAVLCPTTKTGWRVVLSQRFVAGHHTFGVTLADGAVLERVRLERKKERPADYLATLRRLGFEPGAEGNVSRDRALAAMQFIQEQRRAQRGLFCGDHVVLPQPDQPMAAPQVATATAPAVHPPAPPVPPALSPIAPPLLPPQPPASPVMPVTGAGPGS